MSSDLFLFGGFQQTIVVTYSVQEKALDDGLLMMKSTMIIALNISLKVNGSFAMVCVST